MGQFSEMYSGQYGWYTALQYSMIGFLVAFILIPPEHKIYLLPLGVMYALLFWGIQNKYILEKKDKIEGNRFIDAWIVRDKAYSEEILFGFSKPEAIDLKIKDPNKKIEKTEFFQKITAELEAELYAEQQAQVLELDSQTFKMTNIGGNNQLSQPSPTITNNKKGNQKQAPVNPYKNTLTVKIDPKREKKFEDFLEKNEPHAYNLRLYEPVEYFDTDEHRFSRMILICRDEFEKSFVFSKIGMDVDGYSINAQAAKANLVHLAWIGDDFPLMIVDYTERDAINRIDNVIDSDIIQSLKEKVMERMIHRHRNAFKRFEMELRQKSVEADDYFTKWDDLVQDIEDRKLDDIYEDPVPDTENIKIKKAVFGMLIGFALSAIILLGALIGLILKYSGA